MDTECTAQRHIPHSVTDNHASHQQVLEGVLFISAHLCYRHLLYGSQRFQSAYSPDLGAGELNGASSRPSTTQLPAQSNSEHWLLTSSARTGRKMIIVAVLLANSVNKAMTIVMRMTATGGGTPSRGCRRPPIQTDRPDSCERESKQAGERRSCISAEELILS